MKITPRKYAQALAQAFEEIKDPQDPQVVTQYIASLLALLRRRKQFRLLSKIVEAFEHEWNRRRGIVKLKVTYPAQFKNSITELEEKLRSIGMRGLASLCISGQRSSTLIGGVRIEIEDTLIDGSLETRLKTLAKKLIH